MVSTACSKSRPSCPSVNKANSGNAVFIGLAHTVFRLALQHDGVIQRSAVDINATRLLGGKSQSETVWRQADKYGVPRICFINKMDRWARL